MFERLTKLHNKSSKKSNLNRFASFVRRGRWQRRPKPRGKPEIVRRDLVCMQASDNARAKQDNNSRRFVQSRGLFVMREERLKAFPALAGPQGPVLHICVRLQSPASYGRKKTLAPSVMPDSLRSFKMESEVVPSESGFRQHWSTPVIFSDFFTNYIFFFFIVGLKYFWVFFKRPLLTNSASILIPRILRIVAKITR